MMQAVRVAVALVVWGLVSACDTGNEGTTGSTPGGEDPAGQYGEGPEIPWGVVMPDVQIRSLVTGLAGDMVITGNYQDTVDFGGGPLPAPDDFGGYFMVGLDPAGQHRFSVSADYELLAAVDPAGNTVFATDSTVTIAGQRYGSSIGKIDPTGAVVWVREIESTTSLIDHVACDASGRMWIAGNFGASLTLGGEVFALEGSHHLIQLDADGAVRWAVGTLEDIAITMAVVSPDRAMVATSSSVRGLDGEGNERWQQDLPTGMERFVDADIDEQGRTIVVGHAPEVAVDLGGGTLDLGWFMAIFGADGEHLYSRSFGEQLFLNTVRWAPGGGALVWAVLIGEIDLGGGVLSSLSPELGDYTNYSLFLAVDDDGAHVWSALYPDLRPYALGSGPEGTALFAAKNIAPVTVAGQEHAPGQLLGRMPVTLD